MKTPFFKDGRFASKNRTSLPQLLQHDRLSVIGLVGLIATALPCASATITLNGTTYAVTSGTYSGSSDWDANVKVEFGNQATVADFAKLKVDSVGSETALWDFLREESTGEMWVEYNDQKLYTGDPPPAEPAPYFVKLHTTDPGPSWFVIDYIDPNAVGYPDRINLGRYPLFNRSILAQFPDASAIPEPGSVAALAFLLGGSMLIRRRK